MEYFEEYNQFNVLKNYILKDPICDWFEIQKYRDHESVYKKDKPSYYKEFIIKESNIYKENLLQKIRELSKLNIPLNTGFNKTKEMIYNDYPLPNHVD